MPRLLPVERHFSSKFQIASHRQSLFRFSRPSTPRDKWGVRLIIDLLRRGTRLIAVPFPQEFVPLVGRFRERSRPLI